MADYSDQDVIDRQNIMPNAGCVINGEFYDIRNLIHERDTLREQVERMREALSGVVACHGRNPSDAMADMPEIDYIKYTLLTARLIAKDALK